MNLPALPSMLAARVGLRVSEVQAALTRLASVGFTSGRAPRLTLRGLALAASLAEQRVALQFGVAA